METMIKQIASESILEAKKIILAGGVVAMPTETDTPTERDRATDFWEMAPLVISLTCRFREWTAGSAATTK